jgi:molecular chaperone DnaJ
VTVPAGVDDGQSLRLAGKGEQMSGGTPGHLYVVLHVQGDERFRREGADILTEVSIGVTKAALGGEVEVYTLEENCTASATLDIKPGTQPGDHVVRRGQGIPRVGESGRGDQVVRFNVEVPKKLTSRQEELMRELAAELGEDVKEKRGLFGRSKK